MPMKQTVLLCFLLVFLSSPLLSQQTDKQAITLGFSEKIQSRELNETRTLNIYLPAGYSPDSAATYPVIYLLDGSTEEDFIHVCGLVQFGNFPWVNLLPSSIVVGIENTDRKRDFTYPAALGFKFPKELADYQPYYTTAGGSTHFIAFLEKELKPYIDAHYKTNQNSTLIGQSLGGLLATEVLFSKPALFNTYILVSPSLWWDNESLLARQPAAGLQNTSVYIAVGDEGKMMRKDAKKLTGILKTHQARTFFEYFPKENHATIFHLALYSAFKALYAPKK